MHGNYVKKTYVFLRCCSDYRADKTTVDYHEDRMIPKPAKEEEERNDTRESTSGKRGAEQRRR